MYKVWIAYKLNEDGSIPSFVIDGGYFPLADLLHGIADAECNMTKGTVILSDAEMEAHIRSLPHIKEDEKGNEVPVTSEELDFIVTEFIKIKGNS
jgi:hypothetical protein